jgi:hypothetical protein
MADAPKAAQKKSVAKTAAKRKAVSQDPRYREQESAVPSSSETFIRDVVDETLRSILDRRGWPEHTKLHARHNVDVIRDAMRAVRNAPNRDFVLNLVWASLSLGANSGHSAEWVERVARESGKKSTVVRGKKSNAWRAYATERARSLRSKNPTLSQHDLADKIAQEWRNKLFDKVGHSRLVQFISELEHTGQVPQRSGSLS